MKLFAILALAIALPVHATDKHIPKAPIETRTVVVTEKDHDGYLVGALIGAGVTYWIMHRRAKRHAPPAQVRIVPAECPAVVCPTITAETCAEPVRRAEAACGK